jgi:hypothetical protein
MSYLEESKKITVRHACNIGDLIASLAGLNSYWQRTGQKFIYMQELNVPATYHTDYYHPTQEDGKQVMCNKRMFDMIKPLVECQPYIESFEEYSGQKIAVDLSVIRSEINVNMPFGAIQSWYMLAFPDLACDISKDWINVNDGEIVPEHKNKVVINFTERYRNQFIHYYFLKKHQDSLLFAGTEKEHSDFCKKWNLDIPLLIIDDFLHLAQVLKSSKFFLGNQSFCWNLNRAMNLPSILELFMHAPNCIPFVGNDNYGFYHQNALEYYFETLMNKK